MSFENFKSLGVEAHAKAVETKQKERGGSPIENLAYRLVESGTDALKSFANSQMDKKTHNLYITKSFWDKLLKKHSSDLGAVAAGTSIIATHQALIERRFSTKEHAERWNASVVGLPFLRINDVTGRDDVETFTLEKWRGMIDLARRNPSLVSFWHMDNYQLRPNGLEEFINKNRLKKHLLDVLPEVQRIALALKPRTILTAEEVTQRQRTLEELDASIAATQQGIDAKLEAKFGNVLQRQEEEISGAQGFIPETQIVFINPRDLDIDPGSSTALDSLKPIL